jgi:hypothetical protein
MSNRTFWRSWQTVAVHKYFTALKSDALSKWERHKRFIDKMRIWACLKRLHLCLRAGFIYRISHCWLFIDVSDFWSATLPSLLKSLILNTRKVISNKNKSVMSIYISKKIYLPYSVHFIIGCWTVHAHEINVLHERVQLLTDVLHITIIMTVPHSINNRKE